MIQIEVRKAGAHGVQDPQMTDDRSRDIVLNLDTHYCVWSTHQTGPTHFAGLTQ